MRTMNEESGDVRRPVSEPHERGGWVSGVGRSKVRVVSRRRGVSLVRFSL